MDSDQHTYIIQYFTIGCISVLPSIFSPEWPREPPLHHRKKRCREGKLASGGSRLTFPLVLSGSVCAPVSHTSGSLQFPSDSPAPDYTATVSVSSALYFSTPAPDVSTPALLYPAPGTSPRPDPVLEAFKTGCLRQSSQRLSLLSELPGVSSFHS